MLGVRSILLFAIGLVACQPSTRVCPVLGGEVCSCTGHRTVYGTAIVAADGTAASRAYVSAMLGGQQVGVTWANAAGGFVLWIVSYDVDPRGRDVAIQVGPRHGDVIHVTVPTRAMESELYFVPNAPSAMDDDELVESPSGTIYARFHLLSSPDGKGSELDSVWVTNAATGEHVEVPNPSLDARLEARVAGHHDDPVLIVARHRDGAPGGCWLGGVFGAAKCGCPAAEVAAHECLYTPTFPDVPSGYPNDPRVDAGVRAFDAGAEPGTDASPITYGSPDSGIVDAGVDGDVDYGPVF